MCLVIYTQSIVGWRVETVFQSLFPRSGSSARVGRWGAVGGGPGAGWTTPTGGSSSTATPTSSSGAGPWTGRLICWDGTGAQIMSVVRFSLLFYLIHTFPQHTNSYMCFKHGGHSHTLATACTLCHFVNKAYSTRCVLGTCRTEWLWVHSYLPAGPGPVVLGEQQYLQYGEHRTFLIRNSAKQYHAIHVCSSTWVCRQYKSAEKLRVSFPLRIQWTIIIIHNTKYMCCIINNSAWITATNVYTYI